MQIDTLDYELDLAQAFDAGVNSAGKMHGDHGIAADCLEFVKNKSNQKLRDAVCATLWQRGE